MFTHAKHMYVYEHTLIRMYTDVHVYARMYVPAHVMIHGSFY